MATYTYQAIQEDGKTITDVIDADSLESADALIRSRGLQPLRVGEAGAGVSGFRWQQIKALLTPIRPTELVIFTKQFRTLLRAGVSIVNLLQVLEQQTENPNLKRVLRVMAGDIREGKSLNAAFRRHPRVFSPLYCSMVQAGESSGALPEVLERLTYIIEHEFKLKTEIQNAMRYPLFVISLLILAFFVLLTFVMPKFVGIFLNAGLELPLPTAICMFIYRFFTEHSVALGLAVAATAVGLHLYLRTASGQHARDRLMLNLPIIGKVLNKAAMSRFASIFSILQSSGVSVLESMGILSDTVGNKAISKEFIRISERLEQGRGIAGPLHMANYFTPIVVNMIAIGEESGRLDEMLREISDHYDTEVEYATKRMTSAIGPLLVIGLAGVIGFFALAVFLPMWDLMGVIK